MMFKRTLMKKQKEIIDSLNINDGDLAPANNNCGALIT
jgi:hypothetical protein